MNTRPTSAVLFDLDGTLLDTAPDLAYALNTLLTRQGLTALPFETIRPVASHGSQDLLKLGFNVSPTDATFAPLCEELLEIYQTHIADSTKLFPGMDTVLAEFEKKFIPWGIVTNKPAFLTNALLKKIGLYDRAACVVSGDTLPQRKPHPAPILHACELIKHTPENCIYVGDAERDIQAGHHAKLYTLIAAYGYIAESDDMHAWKADAIIYTPEEILEYLS